MKLVKKNNVFSAVLAGGVARANTTRPCRFSEGEFVTARRWAPSGHTRLPGYIRGCKGIVTKCHGSFVFPDTRAHFHGDNPQYLYAVRFRGSDIWECRGGENDFVYLDLWDDYLE